MSPIAAQKIIPINYGKGTAQFMANFRLDKTFTLGAARVHPKPTALRNKQEPSRFILKLGISAQNLLNRVNRATPVGILGSPLFGKSNALAGPSSANRIMNIQAEFTF
jgi:hypothetical protein